MPRAGARPPSARPPAIDLRREGDVWALAHAGHPAIRLKHSKGLGYLQYLLDQPGREVHVLELVGTEHATGDAGPVLDARAKAEYRQRLDDLKDELAEAERFGDQGRVARAQEQIEAIAEQLAGRRRPGRSRPARGLRRRARPGERPAPPEGHGRSHRRGRRPAWAATWLPRSRPGLTARTPPSDAARRNNARGTMFRAIERLSGGGRR